MFLSAAAKGDPPTALGVGITDQYTALHIVIAVLAALAHRAETGEGQKIEVDLFSCAVAMQQQELTFYLNTSPAGAAGGEPRSDLGDCAVRDLRDRRRPYRDRDDPCPVLAEALDHPGSRSSTTSTRGSSRGPRSTQRSRSIFRPRRARSGSTSCSGTTSGARRADLRAARRGPAGRPQRPLLGVPVGNGEASFRHARSPITFSADTRGDPPRRTPGRAAHGRGARRPPTGRVSTAAADAIASISDRLREVGVVPVVGLPEADLAVPLAEALVAGGLSCVEITFRTPAAREVSRRFAGPSRTCSSAPARC